MRSAFENKLHPRIRRHLAGSLQGALVMRLYRENHYQDRMKALLHLSIDRFYHMPYDSAHFAELKQRREKAVSRLLPCMNDTKWREVFLLIARRKLTFQIAWVGESDWPTVSHHTVWESLIENSGLQDPGIGGPCVYRDILWIRVPKTVKWGNGNWFAQNLSPFAADLTTLGTLPLQLVEDGIEIRGYQEPAKKTVCGGN